MSTQSRSETIPVAERERRRDILVLAAGASAGIVLAVFGLLRDSETGVLPPDAAARVNGRVIDNADLADALAALGTDSRDRLDGGDQDWILRRLIEEELLLQRAMELGLGHSDRSARSALVDAMIRHVTRDIAARTPEQTELEAWYGHNIHLFAGAPRLRVQALAADTEEDASRLRRRLLSGEAIPEDAAVAGLPNRLLPPAKLRDYLGPGPTRRMLDAKPGEWSEPLSFAGGWLVARVAERKPGGLRPLAEISDEVELAWRRAQMDEALRHYLEELRSQAEIEIASP